MRGFIKKQLWQFSWKMYVAANELKQMNNDNAKIQVDWPTLVGWPDLSPFDATFRGGKITFANGSNISFFEDKYKSQLEWELANRFAFEDKTIQFGINPVKPKPEAPFPRFKMANVQDDIFSRYFYCHGYAVKAGTTCPHCSLQVPR